MAIGANGSGAAFTYAANQGGFIPEIFSKLLQAKFYSSSVLPAISNTEYEGEITGAGDKVHIRTVPAVTVADYTGSLTYADLTTSTVELLIDQAKSYSFKADDVLKAQGDIDMLSEASKDAAESMRIAVETDVLAGVVTGATTTIGQTTITASNILEKTLDMAKALDELNIPEEGRYIVLSPEFVSMLKLSELRQAYLTGDGTSPLRNGQVGMIDRFTVYQSNLLLTPSSGSDSGYTHILAGHPKAITFASQFVENETIRLQNSFGTGIRGLKVYGFKTVTPNALVVGKWT